MKVCKFGGSSLSDSNQIKKVKDILLNDKSRQIVVVSAPGKRNKDDEKITDVLYKCASLASSGLSIEEEFDKIEKRYREIATGLGLDDTILAAKLDEIKENIEKGKGRAYAASRGEYLSALLISTYLKWNFLDAKDVIVIGEDNKVEEETYSRLEKALKKDEYYVVPGFYGMDKNEEIVTFSRGGSDITGSILAKASSCDLYENWTDVSGVYSSDPRIVPSAHSIKRMSYKEVREFSEVGASVFHEEAIAPCIDKAIPINIRNTNKIEDEGTLITKDCDEEGVIGVSYKAGLSKLYVQKLLFFKTPGMRHKILSLMHIYGIKPCYTLYGCDSISWYFETKMAEKIDIDAMCQRIKEEFSLGEIECKKGFAVIGLVGNKIEETMQYCDALDVLRENSIKPSSVSLGGSYTTFVIGVEEGKAVEATNLISERIFKKV